MVKNIKTLGGHFANKKEHYKALNRIGVLLPKYKHTNWALLKKLSVSQIEVSYPFRL